MNRQWMGSLRDPAIGPFVAGLVVGLIFLSLAGRLASTVPYMEPFKRLHIYISPQSFYYPTASELTDLAASAASGKRIVVIVGGSSVMRGAGQAASDLWSDALQSDLGSRFGVINLAADGGAPTEFGGVVAQAILQRGTPVIYVADGGLEGMTLPAGITNTYVYWDAYYKGLMRDDVARNTYINSVAKQTQTESALADAQMRGRIESWLYDTDLWNWIGFNYIFTVPSMYVYLPFTWPTTPRRFVPDPASTNAGGVPEQSRYPSGKNEEYMAIVRAWVSKSCAPSTEPAAVEQPQGAIWPEFQAEAAAAFPVDMRQHTLELLESDSPYYVSQLTNVERECYGRTLDISSANLQVAGYHTRIWGDVDFTADDYADIVHLRGPGGRKLATLVSSDVAQMARELGYLGDE